MRTLHKNKKSGFTLVEMTVSLAVFTIVLFIATSTFLSVVNSDRKSQSVRIATDNLNLTLEDMARKIKTGSNYSCGGNPGTADCSTAQSIIALDDQAGTRIIYKRGQGSGAIVSGVSASGCGSSSYTATQGCILRSDGGGVFLPATSPEIDITSLNFFVVGSNSYASGDRIQPTVVVSADGLLGDLSSTRTSFKIQTAITQRQYDH